MDFANSHSTLFNNIFNFDYNGQKGYEEIKQALTNNPQTSGQPNTGLVNWADSITKYVNGVPTNDFIDPWQDAFEELAHNDEFIEFYCNCSLIRWYYDNLAWDDLYNYFGLNTVKGYTLALDISVNNGGIGTSNGDRDLINSALEGNNKHK